ncbi:conserved Plasmodium protein, unknown function [Plasmodium sp. gorilla clade G2]|uniref:conserved Plasmodium protein, unknown function n=1 Tax=Plasmodium sp. gorilla clade G2 TaxID=880535 RepID=UPI000D22B883|nr:conserved Plasmodium protein, unknown function [Plasmodium sp. gorilla clade G2]SOV15714.1 conserved Plasmodium protein, unknown function [Plasmodium sp. gorilla clade G2]
MVLQSIKFIVLRPRGIPQNLEAEINCSDYVRNIKNKLFQEDTSKGLNVRFIYMGKILDDKKKLEDYLNFYTQDILMNNKITNIFNENKKRYSTKKMLNDIMNTNINTTTKESVAITIHVKITESFSSSRNDTFDGKNINTSLARLSLIMFVSLLWIYRYNYAHIFPVFSTVVLFIFTIFIATIIFHNYIILIVNVLIQIIITLYQIFKHSFKKIYEYIKKKIQKYYKNKKGTPKIK